MTKPGPKPYPYKTKVIRVPLPCIKAIEKIVKNFKKTLDLCNKIK